MNTCGLVQSRLLNINEWLCHQAENVKQKNDLNLGSLSEFLRENLSWTRFPRPDSLQNVFKLARLALINFCHFFQRTLIDLMVVTMLKIVGK